MDKHPNDIPKGFTGQQSSSVNSVFSDIPETNRVLRSGSVFQSVSAQTSAQFDQRATNARNVTLLPEITSDTLPVRESRIESVSRTESRSKSELRSKGESSKRAMSNLRDKKEECPKCGHNVVDKSKSINCVMCMHYVHFGCAESGSLTEENEVTEISHRDFLSIYCQNISGGRTKTTLINDFLMTTPFAIICVQETWFNESVTDDELIKNTNFMVFRQDRELTRHHKEGGGGVVIFVKREYKTNRHVFSDIHYLQYVCLEIRTETSNLIVANIYSPYGYMQQSNNDIALLLNYIESIHKTETIILGDFNMPRIKWKMDDELPDVFVPHYENFLGNSNEEKFIETFFNFDLKQILPQPSNRNHLDLAFLSNSDFAHFSFPIEEEMLDRISRSHAQSRKKKLNIILEELTSVKPKKN